MTTDPLLTPNEVAEILGIPTATLANWRYQRLGPTYLLVGRHVRTRRADVETWLDDQAVAGRR